MMFRFPTYLHSSSSFLLVHSLPPRYKYYKCASHYYKHWKLSVSTGSDLAHHLLCVYLTNHNMLIQWFTEKNNSYCRNNKKYHPGKCCHWGGLSELATIHPERYKWIANLIAQVLRILTGDKPLVHSFALLVAHSMSTKKWQNGRGEEKLRAYTTLDVRISSWVKRMIAFVSYTVMKNSQTQVR